MADRRAVRRPSSSPGWWRKSASLTTMEITESPRNSSRSFEMAGSSGCSLGWLEWTSASPSRARSRTGSASRAASRAAAWGAAPGSLLGAVLVDVVGRVLDGPDLLRILVGDLGPELFLEAHDELHEVERVGVQVVDERGFGLDILLVHAELLDDDLLQPLVGRSHRSLPPVAAPGRSMLVGSRLPPGPPPLGRDPAEAPVQEPSRRPPAVRPGQLDPLGNGDPGRRRRAV